MPIRKNEAYCPTCNRLVMIKDLSKDGCIFCDWNANVKRKKECEENNCK